MDKVHIKNIFPFPHQVSILSLIQYGYLILPLLLFFLGWTRLYVGLPCSFILLICWLSISQKENAIPLPQLHSKDKKILVIVVVLICIWVYLSGIGKFVFQNEDHNCRNALFEILVRRKWPVVLSAEESLSGKPMMLFYYIGFWLPAALFGKVFGITAGYFFQYFWAVLGVLIFYSLLSSSLNRYSVWALVGFILFSGLDIVGWMIRFVAMRGEWPAPTFTNHLEWWITFQFSSFTTQLFWVFNQALPAWIGILLLYLQRKNRYMVFLLGVVMISSTFGFVGMLPFAVFWMFTRSYAVLQSPKERFFCFCRDTFSAENILGGGTAGILSFFYLIGNHSSQQLASGTPSGSEHSFFVQLAGYGLFLFLEIGLYVLLLLRYQHKNALFYLTVGWLCCCPLFRVGTAASGMDFCMRASIPALVLLYLLLAQSVLQMISKRDVLSLLLLSIVLAVGAVTPMHELARTVQETALCLYYDMPIGEEAVSDTDILSEGNFGGSSESSFFARYLASKP